MSRIDDTFSSLHQRGETALIPFITAGDPALAITAQLVKTLEAAEYQPQKILIMDQKARVWVSITGPELFEFNLIHDRNGWDFYQGEGLLMGTLGFNYTVPANLRK